MPGWRWTPGSGAEGERGGGGFSRGARHGAGSARMPVPAPARAPAPDPGTQVGPAVVEGMLTWMWPSAKRSSTSVRSTRAMPEGGGRGGGSEGGEVCGRPPARHALRLQPATSQHVRPPPIPHPPPNQSHTHRRGGCQSRRAAAREGRHSSPPLPRSVGWWWWWCVQGVCAR